MKKAKLILVSIICLLIANLAFGKDVLQPTNGNSSSVAVFTGDVFYDSGGAGGGDIDKQPGNYLNCQINNENMCVSFLSLCGNGLVCVRMDKFKLATGADFLIIRDGDKNGAILATLSGTGPAIGTIYTATTNTGCLTFEFHGTSILNNLGWEAAVIVKTTTVDREPGDPCDLTCNNSLNASFPNTPGICYRTFEVDDFLENVSEDCEDAGLYEVVIHYPFGTTVWTSPVANQVDRSHLGYHMVYSVYENDAQGNHINSCWGYLTVEDKAGPLPDCRDRTVSCFQVSKLNDVLNEILDNCSQYGNKAKIESLNFINFGCDDSRGIGQVARKIRTWDVWGNSVTCEDTLTIRKDSLIDVICPDNIILPCDFTCDLNGDGDTKDAGEQNLSYVVGNASYPTPELLLAYQKKNCLDDIDPRDTLLLVPHIWDSILNSEDVQEAVLTAMYPSTASFCKISVAYWDKLIPICIGGQGFKIRREWKLSDWCTGEELTCVQYIKVEDTDGPWVKEDSKNLVYSGVVGPHTCLAPITLLPLEYTDCSLVDQSYIIEYQDASHPGKSVILSGDIKATGTKIYLPASPSDIYYSGQRCIEGTVYLVDKCLNSNRATIIICIEDNTPPTPVCDELTQTTVDPSTCWARVYAKDLDNGSRDNCCNVLHFAVAHMDSVAFYQDYWEKKLIKDCTSKDYWENEEFYVTNIERWINCYVFKDYIDLSTCGEHQVILRVYEACGIPRYDPHIFECSEHDWFCYNSVVRFRMEFNFNYFDEKGLKSCDYKPPLACRGAWRKRLDVISQYFYGKYIGSIEYIYGNNDPRSIDICDSKFYTGGEGKCIDCKGSESNAPGNTCSKILYNDCMVRILVDDKTPPVCEEPDQKFWYCDNAGTDENNELEYAENACYEDNFSNDEADDDFDYIDPAVDASNYNCGHTDPRGSYKGPYNEIESVKEYDTDKTDDADPTGKKYGWYGCSIYGPSHPGDEHGGTVDNCRSDVLMTKGNPGGWAPYYCHTWLTLDRNDNAGHVDAKTAFDVAVARVGNPNGESAGDGKFFIWDNCTKPIITYVDDGKPDQCGNGWIRRTWTATDSCQQFTITCSQKIITKHRSDFEVIFPTDITVDCTAGSNLEPEGIGGVPMIMDAECELIGVNKTDVRYDIVGDACYKIVRTWQLVDWCKYDPNQHYRDGEVIVDDRLVASTDLRYCVYRHLKDDGDGFMTYTQIIKVIDKDAPTVTCIEDTSICVSNTDCSLPSFISPDFTAIDICNDEAGAISFRWELDILSDKADIKKSAADQKRFTWTNLPYGKHTVYVIAEDNCSNEDTCTYTITVKDCKKPTPYCYNGIATVIMPSSGKVTVWASDLNAGSYDNCPGTLTYSFGSDRTKTSREFSCADIANGLSQTVFVDIYVWDASLNYDYCSTYLQLQDNPGGACPDIAAATGAIAGKVMTENTEPVENVILETKSKSTTPSFKTDSKGSYSFNGLSMKSDYTITAKRDDDPNNGVSTIDLVLIQKHILGVQPLNSAYKVIAADVDKSNDISVVDLVELRKLILTVYDKLPNNTSWRFAPKTYTFASIANPWGFPEKIDIKGLSQDELARDFVGIKIGDVNGTVVPHSLLGAESRDNGSSLRFRAEDRLLKVGEETVIEFTAENFRNIEGYQFSMALKGLELKGVNSGLLKITENNFGTTKISDNYLTTSWNESKGITANSTDVLFSIKVKATKATSLSESLVINSKYTRAEAFDGKEAIGVSLAIGQKANAGYALHQNTPNPFKATTVISYELAKSDKVNLKVTDVTGKVIRVYTQDGLKGFNQLRVNRNEVGGAGVLYYTIETKDYSATKKMILMD